MHGILAHRDGQCRSIGTDGYIWSRQSTMSSNTYGYASVYICLTGDYFASMAFTCARDQHESSYVESAACDIG